MALLAEEFALPISPQIQSFGLGLSLMLLAKSCAKHVIL